MTHQLSLLRLRPLFVEENAAAGTVVGTVTATDEGEGDDELTFSFASGSTGEAFQIDNMRAITVKMFVVNLTDMDEDKPPAIAA